MKTFLPGLLVLLFSTTLYAQTTYRVSGNLLNEDKEPLAYASVGLFSLPDSASVGGAVSNEDGRFRASLKPGSYYAEIHVLSYETRRVDFTINMGNVVLPDVVLQSKSENLDEVSIIEEKSEMSLRIDKRVFNVGADLSNTGSSASDILANIPSVTLDVDGNVSLRGSENVRILVNGKPSGLTGISGSDALRLIPAHLIERVEIITNPGARYDAEGEVGIINIILKKEEEKGLNGSFEARGGVPTNYGLSANLNYRKKKINYFGSAAFGYSKRPGMGSSSQTFFESDSLLSYDRERRHVRGGASYTLRGGFDWMPNTTNTFSFNTLLKYADGRNTSLLTYRDYDLNDNLIGEVVRDQFELEPENNLEFGFSHLKTFKRKGREWATDFKYMLNDETELADIHEYSTTGSYELYQNTSNTEDELNWFFQSDYIHPFGHKAQFEAGVKSSHRIINNEYSVEQRADSSEDWRILPAFDNHFLYTERIHAAYALVSNEVGSWSYQLGLRGEYSDIKTELVDEDQINRRTYANLFPSAFLNYKLNKSQTFQLSYSRRLSRPRFRHLLPFYGFSDNRNLRTGNPNLNPEFTHSFELGQVRYWKKASFLSSAYYRYRTGVIQRVSQADESGIIYRLPVNLSTENAIGLELSGNYEFGKALTLNGNVNAYWSLTEGSFGEEYLEAETYALNGRLNLNYRKGKRFRAQTSFSYRAPRVTTQGRSLSVWHVDMGASYTVLNQRGTFSLSARDLFNTRKWRWITETEAFYSEDVFQWRSRQVALSFTYRLRNEDRSKGSKRRGFDVNDNIKLD